MGDVACGRVWWDSGNRGTMSSMNFHPSNRARPLVAAEKRRGRSIMKRRCAWGILMVFLGAIFYSGIIATIYLIFRRKPNIYTLFFYAGISFPFFWLFFQNAFSNLNIYTSPLFGIVFIFILSKLSRKKERTLPIQEQSLIETAN